MSLSTIEYAPIKVRPRVYLCGFPKSGLHMIEQAVSTFVQPASDNHWFGTFGHNAWSVKWVNMEHIMPMFASIQRGQFAKGHTGYLPEIARALYGWGIATVFIYRDLRDVVVSQAHHILNADGVNLKHPGQAVYQAMGSFEDVLIACIRGIETYAGIFDRWDLYAGWLDAEWVFPVRFEAWRNGDKQRCTALYTYCMAMAAKEYGEGYAVEIANVHLQTVALEMVSRIRDRKKSKTFRKGKSGGWQAAFTPRVKDVFKQLDPGWLVRLGYEPDNDW